MYLSPMLTKTLSTVLFLFLLAGWPLDLLAKEVVIQNDLKVDLYFTEILNRQNFKIKSRPPDVVKTGTTGSFNIGEGDSYYKNHHLKVEYAVGWSGSSDKVNFGFKKSVNDSSMSCFTHTPTEGLSGKSGGCNLGKATFRFFYTE